MSRRLAVLLVFVFVLAFAGLVTSGSLAWAHPAGVAKAAPIETATAAMTESLPTAEWRSGVFPLPPPWLALACVTAGLLAIRRRPRRALALAIVVILAVFAFENGVHSVHHLDSRASGASCAVASTAAQVAGTPVDATLVAHIALPLLHAILPDSSSNVDVCFFAAHQGRAPPLAA